MLESVHGTFLGGNDETHTLYCSKAPVFWQADDEALKKQMAESQNPFLQMVSAWAYASLNPDDEDAVRQAVGRVERPDRLGDIGRSRRGERGRGHLRRR